MRRPWCGQLVWRGDGRNREDRKQEIYGYHLTRERGGVPSARQGQVSEFWESLKLTRESFWSARSLLDGLLYWNVTMSHDFPESMASQILRASKIRVTRSLLGPDL